MERPENFARTPDHSVNVSGLNAITEDLWVGGGEEGGGGEVARLHAAWRGNSAAAVELQLGGWQRWQSNWARVFPGQRARLRTLSGA